MLVPHLDRITAIDDRELWKRLQAGEPQALAALFRMHYAMLYDYGYKLTRETELVKDSIQEVFAYIWEKRAAVAEAESVRAYLLVSLRRHLYKALELQKRRQTTHEEFDRQYEAEAFSPEDLFILQEAGLAEQEILNQALQRIPARMREALYLKTFEGLPYSEIAAIMKISPQVARNYVFEAFYRLREHQAPSDKKKLEKTRT